MTRRVRTAVAVCLLLVGQSALVGTAAAAPGGWSPAEFGPWESDDRANETAGDGFVSAAARAGAEALGVAARAHDSVRRQVTPRQSGDAGDYAEAAGTAIERDGASLRALANERYDADPDDEVVRLVFTDGDGDTATRYVVTETDGDRWTANPRVLTPEAFAETDRNADHWVVFDDYASRHFAADVRSLPSADGFALRARLLGRYGSGVQSDLLGDDRP